jgi:uncharacterized membrane protein (UPF0127 family)
VNDPSFRPGHDVLAGVQAPDQRQAKGAKRKPMNPPRWIMSLSNRMAPRREAQPESRMIVSNFTRQTVLGTKIEVADTAAKRNKGLLGRQGLATGEGLWIVPCESVHTFFMKFPLDLVYLDRRRRVRKVSIGVPPWRISVCLSAHSILELPPGAIAASQTQPGDVIEFSTMESSR